MYTHTVVCLLIDWPGAGSSLASRRGRDSRLFVSQKCRKSNAFVAIAYCSLQHVATCSHESLLCRPRENMVGVNMVSAEYHQHTLK